MISCLKTDKQNPGKQNDEYKLSVEKLYIFYKSKEVKKLIKMPLRNGKRMGSGKYKKTDENKMKG